MEVVSRSRPRHGLSVSALSAARVPATRLLLPSAARTDETCAWCTFVYTTADSPSCGRNLQKSIPGRSAVPGFFPLGRLSPFAAQDAQGTVGSFFDELSRLQRPPVDVIGRPSPVCRVREHVVDD